MRNLDLDNIANLDESFSGFSNLDIYTKNDTYSNVDGGDGNEDSVEDEGEASEESVPSQDLPKFRQLVKSKKLELKSQYGKGHFDNRSESTRECKKIGWGRYAQEVCANVPHIRVVWVSGWRAKWKEFKRQGGLSQLKQMALGARPLPTTIPFTPTATPIKATATTPTTDSQDTTNTTESNSGKISEGEKDGTTFGINSIAFYSGIGISTLVIGFLIFKIIKNKK